MNWQRQLGFGLDADVLIRLLMAANAYAHGRTQVFTRGAKVPNLCESEKSQKS